MFNANARCGLAAASALSCLVSLSAAKTTWADEVTDSVRIDANRDAEVFVRTDQVTSVPVRVGRYGTEMTRAPVYSPVCARTPCDTELADGSYHLALSKPGGDVIEANAPIDLHGDATIHGTYTDRSVWRGLGILTAVVAPLAGTGLILLGSHAVCQGGGTTEVANPYGGYSAVPAGCTATRETNPVSLATGATVMSVGLIAALVMVLQQDSVSFSIGPYSLGAPPGMRESGLSTARPQGLEMTMRF